jgi:hypothetical protein
MIPTYIIHNYTSGRDISSILAVVPQAVILPAIMYRTNPRLGCTHSHQAAIRLAQEVRAPFVWVIEDDCVFENFSMARWDAYLDLMIMHGCDVLNGGVLRISEVGGLIPLPVTNRSPHVPVNRIEGAAIGGQYWSSHCVVYRKTAYDALLQPTGVSIDALPGHCGLRTMVTLPFMATQRAGHSSISGLACDYDALYRTCEQALTNQPIGEV